MAGQAPVSHLCPAEIFPNKAKIIAFKALSPNYRPEVLQRKAFRKKNAEGFWNRFL